MKISAAIITFNEEKNIAAAIDSVSWADEILIVDSESTDATRDIAAGLGARVIVNKWPGFSAQKQVAADSALNDWVLSIDADERVTLNLREEILSLTEVSAVKDGYRIPRLSVYMGREIRHSGWYPDRQLRLFDRRKARWNERVIHESVRMENGSSIGELKGHLLHFSVNGARHHHEMIGKRYAPLAAEQMFAEGRRTSPLQIAGSGIAQFVRSYFLKAGFLDGLPGFCIASFAAYHAFLKHVLLFEMQNASKHSAATTTPPVDRTSKV